MHVSDVLKDNSVVIFDMVHYPPPNPLKAINALYRFTSSCTNSKYVLIGKPEILAKMVFSTPIKTEVFSGSLSDCCLKYESEVQLIVACGLNEEYTLFGQKSTNKDLKMLFISNNPEEKLPPNWKNDFHIIYPIRYMEWYGTTQWWKTKPWESYPTYPSDSNPLVPFEDGFFPEYGLPSLICEDLFKNNDLQTATTVLCFAVAVAPKFYEAHYNLGHFQYQIAMNLPKKNRIVILLQAIASLQKAHDLNPTHPTILNELTLAKDAFHHITTPAWKRWMEKKKGNK